MNKKPLSLAINETRLSLANICNKSGLSASILELIVKDVLNELYVLNQKQLAEDKLAYMNLVAEQSNSNKSDMSDNN